MSSPASRTRRQQRRAAELGRGVATDNDATNVMGMTVDELNEYAATLHLRARVFNVDGVSAAIDLNAGPDVLNVDIEAGRVVRANTMRGDKP